jgi:hypothetical protein
MNDVKTYPTLTLVEAERRYANVGAFMIRRSKKTGEETRPSVVCYQCTRKT